MSLEHTLFRRGDVIVVRLAGRIDRDAAAHLEAAYAAAAASEPPAVEFDFAAVDYINSTGIALIVGVLARARAERRTMRAVGLSSHYRHIFEITRLSDFIEIIEPVATEGIR